MFDEITNANAEVQAACWQLMDSSRSVGDYKLPDGWLIVAADNLPYEAAYIQYQAFSLHWQFLPFFLLLQVRVEKIFV